jgi:hypothetical protein
MYEPHTFCRVPKPEAVIWRYLDLFKFKSTLDTGCLYFAAIATFAREDHWEAHVPKTLKEIWDPQGGGGSLDRMRDFLRERGFANCWHINNEESIAMWRQYGNGCDNLVLRSTFGKLCQALSNCPETVHIGEVDYEERDESEYRKWIDSGAGARVLNITPLWFGSVRFTLTNENSVPLRYSTPSDATRI